MKSNAGGFGFGLIRLRGNGTGDGSRFLEGNMRIKREKGRADENKKE